MAHLGEMLDAEAAIERLLRLLAIEGVTGEEAAIAQEVRACLIEAGVPESAIRFDDAHTRIPVPTQTGNLIVTLPGRGIDGPTLLFSAHMDTVPLTAGVKPVRLRSELGDRIESETTTALGGDDRTGVAVMLTLVAELIRQQRSHPPITLLFTVREESGLFGARHLNREDLPPDLIGFNFDGKSAADVTIGAIGAYRWEALIRGKAAHAGVAPARGISATMVAALALSEVFEGGWFGRVDKPEGIGTSNVGSIGDSKGRSAGNATNVVTDEARLTGECRSHNADFASTITQAYERAFRNAVDRVRDLDGNTAELNFDARLDYHPFCLDEASPVVQRAREAVRSIGREPTIRIADGGLDANWLGLHGIPTVTLGAGQNEIHTIKEYVELNEYLDGCRVALALATLGG